jgi:hypothetical protein
MQPVLQNSGWKERNSLFREGFSETGKFRKEGVTFFGRYYLKI